MITLPTIVTSMVMVASCMPHSALGFSTNGFVHHQATLTSHSSPFHPRNVKVARHERSQLHFWNLPFFGEDDSFSATATTSPAGPTIAEQFFRAYFEHHDIERALACFEGYSSSTANDDNGSNTEFLDRSFEKSFQGMEEIERYLRLNMVVQRSTDVQIQNIVVNDDDGEPKVGIYFQSTHQSQQTYKGLALFTLHPQSKKIQSVAWIPETAGAKGGEANLKLLSKVSKIVARGGAAEPAASSADDDVSSLSIPEQYFAAWSKRDMEQAVSLFEDDVVYDDTAFPQPFAGKEALGKHLNICAGCFPPTFAFDLMDKAIQTNKDNTQSIVTTWRVNNNGKPLPYAAGISYYEISANRKIQQGIDIVEPPPIKSGGWELFVSTLQFNLANDPKRWAAIAIWVTYMYVVFLSDWFFGLPATALEERTWIEVRDLSINFFLVSPILQLPFAPIVHPMMEGTFNLLLSWAALFAGFLSDDRKNKPNIFPMLPAVAGMQFLTSAFLLPYLALRSTEDDVGRPKPRINGSSETSAMLEFSSAKTTTQDELSFAAQLVESPWLGGVLGGVGTVSIAWGIFARDDLFGGWDQRLPSFLELLSIDRVGSSFIVDLAIFAIFQGWLVDDDCRRRGMSNDSDALLMNAAKFVPFFGLAAYMTLRKPISDSSSSEAVGVDAQL